MNVFCSCEINDCILGANLSARILEISFATLWIIVIGL